MAQQNFKVVLNDRAWRSFFGGIKVAMKNPIPKLGALASTMGYRNILEHFKGESDPEGNPWTAWSKRYADWRGTGKGKGKKPKILQLSGDLRKTIQQGQRGKRYKPKGTKGVVLYTVGVPYAHRHDEGTKGMPDRKFMGLDSGTQQKMVDALAKWLAER